jgi:hypothetical protein
MKELLTWTITSGLLFLSFLATFIFGFGRKKKTTIFVSLAA